MSYNIYNKATDSLEQIAGGADNRQIASISAKVDEVNAKVEADDTYSTEEVRTNKKWIDGKPIYRIYKEFENINMAQNTWQTLTTIPNVDFIVNATLYRRAVITYVADGVYLRVNGNNIEGFNIRGSGQGIDTILMEYTKTTD